MSDEILFAEDDAEEEIQFHGKWKVLIVDDEPEVHAVTKLALGDFVFQDKNLEFISAFDGEEAKKMFVEHNDIAVVLLDVVMETDDAGLKVAEYIRNEVDNHFTRIILRTGQPGQAPERDVIINYDINDYKSKTELTAQKLFTVVIAALRSYRDIIVIEENRQGLEKIISASADLFSLQSLEHFIEGILQQLASLLGGSKDAAYLTSAVVGPKPIEQYNSSELYVFTGKGEYENKEGNRLEQVITGKELISCQQAYANKSLVYEDEYLVAYCDSKTKKGSLLYMSGLPRKLTDIDKRLVEIFSQNVQIAFDNVLLNKDIEDTQKEIIERIAKALETNFGNANHTQRIVKICEVLGRAAGLSKEELKALCLAVPLYDIGKIKVADDIMLKSGSLDQTEMNAMRNHAEFGYNVLKDSNRPLIKSAALIARDHHEYWNGKGYPRGKSGKGIHIFCRITSLADAFDAMRTKRSYKEAWPVEKVMQVIEQEKGQQFDPDLVELLLKNIDEIESIMLQFPSENNNDSSI
jgi:response regulator RpfG family c-di-GMP phosphodiesterase